MSYSDLKNKTAVVTGGGGAICGEIAEMLAGEGVSVSIWDISLAAANDVVTRITKAGGSAIGLHCNVMDRAEISHALNRTIKEYKKIDILINGAGGSRKETTTSESLSFFNIVPEEIQNTISLNYLSIVLPSQIVGRIFADQGHGVILNITSIAGVLPLTRSWVYSDSKAAAVSFTRWLAVHMAQEYSKNIRVNAIAPGFVITDQNRFLLVDKNNGEYTKRGEEVVRQVPLGRYGNPKELAGAAMWLVSDAAAFVTGTIIPVDGGFMAYSGV